MSFGITYSPFSSLSVSMFITPPEFIEEFQDMFAMYIIMTSILYGSPA